MGRTAVADFFGTKKRVPAFDFGGVDVIVDGRFNGTDRRYVLNATKPVLNAAGTELSFSPVYALNTSSEGQVDGLVDDVLKRTADAKMMNTSSASKLEDVVVVVEGREQPDRHHRGAERLDGGGREARVGAGAVERK